MKACPGSDDFRVIEFREHGIPIATPEDVRGSPDPDTKPTPGLLGSHDPSDIAQLQFRASTPLMALVLTLVAVPLSKLRPRQGRYARVGFAIVVYFVYSNLLSAVEDMAGEERLAARHRRVVGACRGLGARLVLGDARREEGMNTLDRYLYRTVLALHAHGDGGAVGAWALGPVHQRAKRHRCRQLQRGRCIPVHPA